MPSITQRYNALPRSGRWLVWTVAVVVVYFGVVERVLEMTAASKSRADSLAAGLQKERDLTSPDSEQGRVLENGRRSFGEPYLPEDPANRPEALHTLVDTILTKHGVVGNRVKNERKVRIAKDEAERLLGTLAATNNVERLILDITFEASPEIVTAVIADLEQAKEVAAISRIELRRPDAGGRGAPTSSGRVVKATISPEAWITAPFAPGATTGGLR